MTDKKDIINPDEDFELDGLSEFVEDLNKDTNKVSSVKDETVSDNSNEEDIQSFLNDSNILCFFLTLKMVMNHLICRLAYCCQQKDRSY